MPTTMTDLARELRAHMHNLGMPCSGKTAKEAISFLFDQISAHAEAGEVVRITGFGSFRVVKTKAGKRQAFGRTITVKAKKKLRFRASAAK